jgi:hypothetical protein
MNHASDLDAAHDAAVHELIGSHGIVGVGRGRDQLVFFVCNPKAATPLLKRWSRGRDVDFEVKTIRGFVHANQRREWNVDE